MAVSLPLPSLSMRGTAMNITDMIHKIRDGVYITQAIIALFGVYLLNRHAPAAREEAVPHRRAAAARFLDEIATQLEERNVNGVAEICDSPVLLEQGRPTARARRVAEPASQSDQTPPLSGRDFEREVLADFDFRQSWIVTIVRAAPMLGLLGTVLALIAAFTKIADMQQSGLIPASWPATSATPC